MTIVYTGYRYRIYPTPEQEEYLHQAIGGTRKIYNLMLEGRNRNYQQYKEEGLSRAELNAKNAALTPQHFKGMEEYSYLKNIDNVALSGAWMNLNTAFNRFFKKESSYPKFKSKNRDKWSFTTSVSNRKNPNIRISSQGLKIPKVKEMIPVSYHRPIRGVLKSATITKGRDHRWFVSIRTEQEIDIPEHPLTTGEISSPIGIDLGLVSFLVDNYGRNVDNPKLSRKYKKKLSREQRKLSRRGDKAKKEGRVLHEAKNYQSQRVRVARIHFRIKNERQDFLHKLSSDIVNNHDFVAVEDLHAKNLLKNHSLAYSISDASWGEFVSLLEYKCQRKGIPFVKVSSFFPSTQLCSSCGEKTGPRGNGSLGIREWSCSYCGVVHDRDVNAARNVLFEGLSLFFFNRSLYHRDGGKMSVTDISSLGMNTGSGAFSPRELSCETSVLPGKVLPSWVEASTS